MFKKIYRYIHTSIEAINRSIESLRGKINHNYDELQKDINKVMFENRDLRERISLLEFKINTKSIYNVGDRYNHYLFVKIEIVKSCGCHSGYEYLYHAFDKKTNKTYELYESQIERLLK